MTSHVFIQKNAILTYILSTLFSSTSVLFSCTPFGTKSYVKFTITSKAWKSKIPLRNLTGDDIIIFLLRQTIQCRLQVQNIVEQQQGPAQCHSELVLLQVFTCAWSLVPKLVLWSLIILMHVKYSHNKRETVTQSFLNKKQLILFWMFYEGENIFFMSCNTRVSLPSRVMKNGEPCLTRHWWKLLIAMECPKPKDTKSSVVINWAFCSRYKRQNFRTELNIFFKKSLLVCSALCYC